VGLSTVASTGAVAGSGTPVTDTATLSGTVGASGTLYFYLYGPGDASCSGVYTTVSTSVSGVGSYASPPVSAPNAGSYNWTASYVKSGGGTTNEACDGTDETSVVAQATPTVTTPGQSDLTAGDTASDSATVAGGDAPSGNVTFKLFTGGSAVYTDSNETINGSGVANSGTSGQLAAGPYCWVATYNGDNNNNSESSNCASEEFTVNPASPSITTNVTNTPSGGFIVGDTIKATAKVTGGFNAATDGNSSITFKVYTNNNCTALVDKDANLVIDSSGKAKLEYTPPNAGTYYVVAYYNGDNNNNAENSGCASDKVVVGQASVSISTSNSGKGAIFHPIYDSAQVTGGDNPTGTVTFTLYGAKYCDDELYSDSNEALVGGSAYSDNYYPTAPGTDYWVATYNGDTNNASVSSGCNAEPVTISKTDFSQRGTRRVARRHTKRHAKRTTKRNSR
jgi:hypothetical protein